MITSPTAINPHQSGYHEATKVAKNTDIAKMAGKLHTLLKRSSPSTHKSALELEPGKPFFGS